MMSFYQVSAESYPGKRTQCRRSDADLPHIYTVSLPTRLVVIQHDSRAGEEGRTQPLEEKELSSIKLATQSEHTQRYGNLVLF